jgi:hypothetical protein
MTSHTESKLTVAWWPTDKPVPYGRNPRVAPEAAITKVPVRWPSSAGGSRSSLTQTAS